MPVPYTLLSCAVSADGYLDDASPERLILSGPEDLDRVDELRATCDAILVGAGTVRADNPRLLIRSPARQQARVARGLPPHPLRVTVTRSGNLDPAANIFTGPGGPALVYGPGRDQLSLRTVFSDLTERGVARLLIEGGSHVLTEALTTDLANELHLAVAPFFVGEVEAPRYVLPGKYPQTGTDPMTLAEVRRVGHMAVSRYLLGPGGRDERYLAWAVELARQCQPSRTAFSVGAVIVSAEGEVLSTGYSRETEPADHAEEVALRKLGALSDDSGAPPGGPDPRLRGATIYSSLVPCGARASRPVTCVRRIFHAGIPRVVYAWREPPLFAAGDGADQLRALGVETVEIPRLASRAASFNAHLV